MATIKSFTSLWQSKKLAEILPIESADMWWSRCTITDFGDGVLKVSYAVEPCNISQFRNTKEDVPCWSLASLLSVLPKMVNHETLFIETSAALWHIGYRNVYTARADNLVDACYSMIIKLRELKLL